MALSPWLTVPLSPRLIVHLSQRLIVHLSQRFIVHLSQRFIVPLSPRLIVHLSQRLIVPGILAAAILAAGLTAAPAGAQEPVEAAVEGTLRFGGGAAADSGTVVLHRVTPEESGALDSVRVESSGAFRIPLPAMLIPGSGEIYFASFRFDGIVYFGRPLTDPIDLDAPYEIFVYPVRAAPPGGMEFPVEVRNLLLEEGPMGWRVVDLFQIHNETEFTWISDPEDQPVWRYPLPPGARNFRVGDSDLTPDAVLFEGGALQVFSPISPGHHLYTVQYEIEPVGFALPLPGETGFLDILVREPAPGIRIPALARGATEEIEAGSRYRRWSGEGLQGLVVQVEEGEEGEEAEGPRSVAWIGVVLALVLGGVGIWATARMPAPPPSRGTAQTPSPLSRMTVPDGDPSHAPTPPVTREQILLQVARLDEDWEASGGGEAEHEAYLSRRESLLARLSGSRGSSEVGEGM